MEEPIYTIDINKCRRNTLSNYKYNYCVFNVMDDVQVFHIYSEIIEGLFYIETDKYNPLRGNGWYYQPLTSYCLEKGIISPPPRG